jgi:hypothetical protein
MDRGIDRLLRGVLAALNEASQKNGTRYQRRP